MASYEKLLTWKKSIELTKCIYRVTSKIPPSEKYNLISQMIGELSFQFPQILLKDAIEDLLKKGGGIYASLTVQRWN